MGSGISVANTAQALITHKCQRVIIIISSYFEGAETEGIEQGSPVLRLEIGIVQSSHYKGINSVCNV